MEVLQLCELTRQELVRAWCEDRKSQPWSPKCEINLHASRGSYVQTVGAIGAQTLGSSRIRLQNEQVSLRRIDLLVSPGGELPALPHELTHIVLADCFGGRQPPHWLDEGAAMLADTQHKQSLHQRDCRHALRQGTCLPLSELLRLEQFTSPLQMPAFYGQSASLLRFFCERGDLLKVTRFSLDAVSRGYDQALREHYGIAGVVELDQQWKGFAYDRDSATRSLRILSVSFRP